MALTALAAGGIGYLLGKDNDEKDANMGLVVEKEDEKEDDYREEILKAATPTAKVKKEEVENYHQINTAGMTWAGIIKTYYPDLVEKCNGKMYGNNGAIRVLKNAIKECSGIDLVNETDIPNILNLPLKLDGIDVKKDGKNKKDAIKEKGGHTDISEAGCKNKKTYYTVTDDNTNESYKHEKLDTAVDSLKARTGAEEYKLDYAS